MTGRPPLGRPTRPSLLLAATVLVVACGADSAAGGTRADAGNELLVLAAASLTDAFGELAASFEQETPRATVELSFGSSADLASSIVEGAPASVFASADQNQMLTVTDAGGATGAEIFATNRLEIAVPPGNPGDVEGLADFAREELLIGLCAEEAPCGDLAREALARAGVVPVVDTDEPDVRAVLTKVKVGELDAGIVYRTDVIAAGDAVIGVEIPDRENAIARYSIVALSDGPAGDLATDFVAFTLGAEGRQILAGYGFSAP